MTMPVLILCEDKKISRQPSQTIWKTKIFIKEIHKCLLTLISVGIIGVVVTSFYGCDRGDSLNNAPNTIPLKSAEWYKNSAWDVCRQALANTYTAAYNQSLTETINSANISTQQELSGKKAKKKTQTNTSDFQYPYNETSSQPLSTSQSGKSKKRDRKTQYNCENID